MTVSSMLLAQAWKIDPIPSLREWGTKVYYIFSMSELLAIGRAHSGVDGAWEQFNK